MQAAFAGPPLLRKGLSGEFSMHFIRLFFMHKPHSCMNETAIKQLLEGEILIDLEFLPDDVVGVSGNIYINATHDKVWATLTDYDNLSKNLPKVISSRVVARNGKEIILSQTGKTGIFIFEKTLHFSLKVREEYPKKISFEQEEGDFSVYRGNWVLESCGTESGILLSYNAEIKPHFFAPPILVSFVQRQDLPGILKAHKLKAESL